MKINFRLGIMGLLGLLSSFPAGADLLVVRSVRTVAGSPAILRLDEQTGAIKSEVSLPTERLCGLAIERSGDMYAVLNMAGYGEIRRVTSTDEVPGGFASRELTLPGSARIGPDGCLYVICAEEVAPHVSLILKYDPDDGRFLGEVVRARGDMGTFTDLAFNAQGQLLVTDWNRGVLRFDRKTGKFLGVLVPASPRVLQAPSAICVGPDGNVFVANRNEHSVSKFHAVTGKLLRRFVSPGRGGLNTPMGLTFGQDGHLYVSSSESGSILKFHGQNGTFLGPFSPRDGRLHKATRLAFTPR